MTGMTVIARVTGMTVTTRMTGMTRMTRITRVTTITRVTRMSGIVCITGALSAKQGERGILREAQDEGGNKLSASYQSIALAFPTFTT